MGTKLLQLLLEARRHLDDKRLYRDELSGQKRSETRQEHADRLSTWIQENEDLRELREQIDEALQQSNG